MVREKLTIRAYLKDGMYYAKDRLNRLWGGPAKTKGELRKQIAAFNRKKVNAPRLVLK